MSEMLKAFCRRGHSWDVWAERGLDDQLLVEQEDQLCPSCPRRPGTRPARAVRYEEPESLA